MVKIKRVAPHSPAQKAGISAGEELVRVNCHEIKDVLDYQFYICEKKLTLTLFCDGKEREVKIRKDEYEDIGLEFETYLMDSQTSCTNKCIFCFIDQNPHGMRESIYFKDDDTRLAFLFGNYVTLTNVSDDELDRLIKMRISPINVSVQTTNPELRCKMLNNRFAGRVLEQMKRLADAGIELQAQIVLCKGINDGAELDRSLSDLSALFPRLTSISVVPVGLTRHRRGLYPLEPFEREDALKVLDQIEKRAAEFERTLGTKLVFASDEFYIRAGRPLPDVDFYEGFPQLENGVGMLTLFEDELDAELEYPSLDMPPKDTMRRISVATGYASYDMISRQVEKIQKIWYNVDCKVYRIKNDFYGESVTVSGLLTGQDLIAQLKGQPLGDVLLIPRNALRHEGDCFLDGVELCELERELGVKVLPTDDGVDFLRGILGV